ncbi:MAG: hypothetical protein AAF645_08080 [Myxococcota bacterium]
MRLRCRVWAALALFASAGCGQLFLEDARVDAGAVTVDRGIEAAVDGASEEGGPPSEGGMAEMGPTDVAPEASLRDVDRTPDSDGSADDLALDESLPEPLAPILCGRPLAELEFDAPELIAEVASLIEAIMPGRPGVHFDPAFSADGLTLYFTSDHEFEFKVWSESRATLDGPFDGLERAPADINGDFTFRTDQFGFQPVESLNLAAITASYPVMDLEPPGRSHAFVGRFVGGAYEWSVSPVSFLHESISDVRLSLDGLQLYYGAPGAGERDIYVSKRPDLASAFETFDRVPFVTQDENDSAPAPVRDPDTLLFVRAGTDTGDDLFVTNLGLDGRPVEPVELVGLNSSEFDGEPVVLELPGRCELVFVSSRGDAFKLWRSVITPRTE